MLKSDAIKRAAEESGATAGGVSRLAEIFEITRSAVSQWPDGPLPQSRIYELMAKRPAWFADAEAAATENREERAESLALAAANGVAV